MRLFKHQKIYVSVKKSFIGLSIVEAENDICDNIEEKHNCKSRLIPVGSNVCTKQVIIKQCQWDMWNM